MSFEDIRDLLKAETQASDIPPEQEATLHTQFPIFLLPDITGDCYSLKSLSIHLSQLTNVPVYLWHDDSANYSPYQSFSDYAEHIKKEMIAKHPTGPYQIGGYSFGGSLAYEIAQKLTAEDKEVSLFILDTPSIETSRDALQPNNIHTTASLLDMFNHAAKVATHRIRRIMPQSPTPQLAYNQDGIRHLSNVAIDEQIETLRCALVQELQENTWQNKFRQIAAMVKLNLTRWLNYTSPSTTKLPNIVGMITSPETEIKYGTNIANTWLNHCEKIVRTHPRTATHQSLVNQHSMSAATLMANYFRENFPAEAHIRKQIKVFKQYKHNFNIGYVLSDAEDSPDSSPILAPLTAPRSPSPTNAMEDVALLTADAPVFPKTKKTRATCYGRFYITRYQAKQKRLSQLMPDTADIPRYGQ